MARQRVWYLPGSPVTSLLASVSDDFDARPLPEDGRAAGEDGALLVDLDGGDSLADAETVARTQGVPIVALVGANAAEAPPLACHAFLTKPVPSFVLATALDRACQHARLEREQLAARRELQELYAIGVGLTAERDMDALLELILTKARAITRSDAGSIYLVEEPEDGPPRLRFRLAQNDTVPVPFTEFTLPISEDSIAGYVALTGEAVLVDDAYRVPESYRFRINRDFDAQVGYRTKSMLVVAMRTPVGHVTGVLQLINCKADAATRFGSVEAIERGAIPYSARFRDLAASLASQAAVALDNGRLYASIQRLFEGFVKASVKAIESRDPTTSGHSERVAALTEALATAVERCTTGPLRDVRFTADQMRELRYASLLHDFGKVGVREEVLVKAKKLQPWHLELVRHRAEVIKRGVELRHAREKLRYLLEHGRAGYEERAALWDAELACQLDDIDRRLKAVAQANEPLLVPDDAPPAIEELARRSFVDHTGEAHAVITPDEARILAIPRGSLTPEEFEQIQSHVQHTDRFLREIPWTRELRRIPDIARGHHEKLNGSGYPARRRGEEIPLETRMITIADIFDALTATDRPYKAAVPVEAALDILRQEAAAGAVDGVLLELFINARPWEARRS